MLLSVIYMQRIKYPSPPVLVSPHPSPASPGLFMVTGRALCLVQPTSAVRMLPARHPRPRAGSTLHHRHKCPAVMPSVTRRVMSVQPGVLWPSVSHQWAVQPYPTTRLTNPTMITMLKPTFWRRERWLFFACCTQSPRVCCYSYVG